MGNNPYGVLNRTKRFLTTTTGTVTGNAGGVLLPICLYTPLVILAGFVGHILHPNPSSLLAELVPWLPVPAELYFIAKLIRRAPALGCINLILGAILTCFGMALTYILLVGGMGPD